VHIETHPKQSITEVWLRILATEPVGQPRDKEDRENSVERLLADVNPTILHAALDGRSL
jgi:hypothetical protein